MTAVARRAATEAGALIRARLGAPVEIDSKGTSDYVTDVDRSCEEIIVRLIRRRFPGHQILSEETPFEGWRPGVTWVVDPLDGTANFIQGFPFVSVSIAALADGEVVLGLILDPVRREVFSAQKGRGVHLNGRPVKVRCLRCTGDALVSTGFPHRHRELVEPYLDAFRAVFGRVADMRRMGSAALDLAYVACGRMDGFWEPGLKIWDVAAGSLMVTEAGGRVSDFWGQAGHLRNGHIVAGSPAVHSLLVEQIGIHLAPALGAGPSRPSSPGITG
jgi:myo-inositol-1(or 4)-monophosphatase